jgi:hypothetical protein
MTDTLFLLLILTVALTLGLAVYNLSKVAEARRRARDSDRDDLMALADATTPCCGAVGVANAPDHRMHACHLPPGHTDALHWCGHAGCGTYWRTAAHERAQIAQLDEMFAAQNEPDRRYR